MSTASLVFSGKGPVAEATGERVSAAAAELGFTGPNPLASSLRQGRSGAIGVLVEGRLRMAFRDPFAIAVLDGLAEVLEAVPTGMLLIGQPRGAGESVVPQLAPLALDAVVFSLCGPGDNPAVEHLAARGIPMFSTGVPSDRRITQVRIDERAAGSPSPSTSIRSGTAGWPTSPCRCSRRARRVPCPTTRCSPPRPTCPVSVACSASATSSGRTHRPSRPATGRRSRAGRSRRAPCSTCRAGTTDRRRRPVRRHRGRRHPRRGGARPARPGGPQRHRLRRRRPAVAPPPADDDGPARPREGPHPRHARAQAARRHEAPQRHPARGAPGRHDHRSPALSDRRQPTGGKKTPRVPGRALLPLLHSCPGGVRRGTTTRGADGQCMPQPTSAGNRPVRRGRALRRPPARPRARR